MFNALVSRPSIRHFLRRLFWDKSQITDQLVEQHWATAHQAERPLCRGGLRQRSAEPPAQAVLHAAVPADAAGLGSRGPGHAGAAWTRARGVERAGRTPRLGALRLAAARRTRRGIPGSESRAPGEDAEPRGARGCGSQPRATHLSGVESGCASVRPAARRKLAAACCRGHLAFDVIQDFRSGDGR